jgi:predicted Zn-dependent protease
MLSKEECQALIGRAVEKSKADEVKLHVSDQEKTHIRFARNGPTTSGAIAVPKLSIKSTFGKRSGSVTINQFDDENLAAAVGRSEELAKLAPEDPEHMPGLGESAYPSINAFDAQTA